MKRVYQYSAIVSGVTLPVVMAIQIGASTVLNNDYTEGATTVRGRPNVGEISLLVPEVHSGLL